MKLTPYSYSWPAIRYPSKICGSSKHRQGYCRKCLTVKGKRSGAPMGTIFRAFLGTFVVASQHLIFTPVQRSRSIAVCLFLLDQLKFDTVAFFTSARTVDSNDVKNYVRYGRAFTVPRCF